MDYWVTHDFYVNFTRELSCGRQNMFFWAVSKIYGFVPFSLVKWTIPAKSRTECPAIYIIEQRQLFGFRSLPQPKIVCEPLDQASGKMRWSRNIWYKFIQIAQNRFRSQNKRQILLYFVSRVSTYPDRKTCLVCRKGWYSDDRQTWLVKPESLLLQHAPGLFTRST